MLAPRRFSLVAPAFLFTCLLTSLPSCSHAPPRLPGDPKLRAEGEAHLDQLRELTHGGPAAHPAWTPDGTRVSFERVDAASSCPRIISVRTDGTDERALTPLPAAAPSGIPIAARDAAYLPPDGDRVMFAGADHCPAATAPGAAASSAPPPAAPGDGARTLDFGFTSARDFTPDRTSGSNVYEAAAKHLSALATRGRKPVLAAYSAGSRARLTGLLATSNTWAPARSMMTQSPSSR